MEQLHGMCPIVSRFIVTRRTEQPILADASEGFEMGRLPGGGYFADLGVGDFFGEMCLFDEGQRSADVIANRECVLLKISKKAFDDLIVDHPAIGALFLRAMMRVVVSRVRKMDKKYVDSMVTAF